MDYPVKHPLLRKKKVSVRLTLLKTAKLFVDDVEQKKTTIFKRRYHIQDDTNRPVVVGLELDHFLDPVPIVKINEEIVRLAPKMRWHEKIWLLLLAPLLAGGALGIVVMFTGATIISKIIRRPCNAVSRYASIVATLLACYSAYLLSGMAFHYFLN